MSDLKTSHMLPAYLERFGAPMFLASFFTPRTFTSEVVEVDIQRSTGKVAIVVKDIASGARQNTFGKFSNKEMRPAVIKESFDLSGFDLPPRQPGQITHFDPDYGANLNAKVIRGVPEIVDKARRTVELMAAQVLQTGEVTLTDSGSAEMYTITFDPKGSHFPTVTTSWGANGATPLADLDGLARAIKADGRTRATRAIFGRDAWQNFIADESVQRLLDNRRTEIGSVDAKTALLLETGNRRGTIDVGTAILECWTYDGDYEDPVSEEVVPFVGDDNVILVGQNARLDICYGAIPYVRRPDPEVMRYLPSRVPGAGLDLSVNGYFATNNQALTVEIGTRPIAIPTAIDTFGCLTTTAGSV